MNALVAPTLCPAQANHYIESHPQSHFRKNLVVARQTAMGRVTILNDQFRCGWRGTAGKKVGLAACKCRLTST